MHIHDPEGFELREPTAKKITRFAAHPVGIHEKWAGDGHDKLYKIGFPAWGVVDVATGKWLGGWIVPSNRMADIVAYCFLCLVEKFGGKNKHLMVSVHNANRAAGIPVQFTSDHGSETTFLFGLMNALRYDLTCGSWKCAKYTSHISRNLRRIFGGDLNPDELPAHVYMKSIYNVAIERSWLRLRLDFGDNAVIFFNKGIEDGTYNPDDQDH